MNLTVRHLKTIGCQASGLISDEDLVKAVDAETRRHDYDEIVLMTGSQEGSWLARTLQLDPVHKLQRHWGRSSPPSPPTAPSQMRNENARRLAG